jgi:acyl-CoA thioester hydrolase
MIPGYPVTARIEIRWRDLDALGHVNNAVYFTYLEIARGRYMEQAFQTWTIHDVNFVVASIRCDFLSQVARRGAIEVGIRIPSVGKTSFDFEYDVRTEAEGRAVARAYSTQVLFDFGRGEKIPITSAWLDRVAAVEGCRPPSRER